MRAATAKDFPMDSDQLEEELLEELSNAIYKVLPSFDNNLTNSTWEEIKTLVAKIVAELN